MTLTEIFTIIFIHWIADFVFQTDKQARGKSSSWMCLLEHTIIYSVIWFAAGIIYAIFHVDNNADILMIKILKFAAITFIAHTITDYYTSKINKQFIPEREYAHNYGNVIDKYSFFRYKNESWHNFFVSVGFDQVLHYVQLFLTYQLLK